MASELNVSFQPRPDLMQMLLEFGFDDERAMEALYWTGNNDPDVAASWLFDNPAGRPIDLPTRRDAASGHARPPGVSAATYTSPGQPAEGVPMATAASSSSRYNSSLSRSNNESDESVAFDALPSLAPADQASDLGLSEEVKMVFVVNDDLHMGVGKVAAQVAHAAVDLYRDVSKANNPPHPVLRNWLLQGCKKVVLRGSTALQLMALADSAAQLGLNHHLVADAGRTQVQAGSVTVLGILGPASHVDSITGNLSLL